MKKHIIGQALYQLIVILFLIFTADSWVPEYLPKEDIQGLHGELKYFSSKNTHFPMFLTYLESGHMRSGRAYLVPNGEEDYRRFEPV